MSILGHRVVRVEDPRLLTGGATFIDNLPIDGAAWVTYVRSSIAHGRLLGVDGAAARAMPGVLAVVTAADVDLGPAPRDMDMLPTSMPCPLLARDVVRYVGEPVAAVVTETRGQGEDAAEAVVVDVEPLRPVVDPEAALGGEVLLFPAAGTNVCLELSSAESISFDGCEVVVRMRLQNQRVAPCPLEGRVAASRWEPDGRLTHWQAGQGAHPIRERLCALYGLDASVVRVITPDVGGGFGAKAASYNEDLLLPWLSRRVGRPVPTRAWGRSSPS